jgi:hypothetical protein
VSVRPEKFLTRAPHVLEAQCFRILVSNLPYLTLKQAVRELTLRQLARFEFLRDGIAQPRIAFSRRLGRFFLRRHSILLVYDKNA